MPILVGLFLVNLVFPPALVVTAPLKFLVCGWLLAWDFLDYPLGLHRYGLRARLAWVARLFWACPTCTLAGPWYALSARFTPESALSYCPF